MPCCWDALSARMIERAGFPLTFMSGFAVSAARLALPDTGLISHGEMRDTGRDICAAVSIPVIGDGDTGHGNALNVERTVHDYARAGFAAIMIEDQIAPKRCGHTRGKDVVDRAEAMTRIRAALAARDAARKGGRDILVLARTDARATLGLDEALWRIAAFADLGADLLFVEGPVSEAELARIPEAARGIHMANMVEGGVTPIVAPARLAEMGYRLAAWPLAALSAALEAIRHCLDGLAREGLPGDVPRLDFPALQDIVGFPAYWEAEAGYGAAEAGERAGEGHGSEAE